MKTLVLIGMLWAHVLDDFILQGPLAQLKMRAWWERQIPALENTPYRNDYRAALAAHAFCWACAVMALPVLLATFRHGCAPARWLPLFAVNAFWHGYIDDRKANKRRLSLLQDQGLHLLQILVTWLLFAAAGLL